MFGTQGLVYCPIGSSKELISNAFDFSNFNLDKITTEFTQIGDPVTMWVSHNEYQFTAEERTLSVMRDFEVYDCYSIIPNFGIDGDIYQSLVQRYTQQELIFPTQILTFTTMSKKLSSGHSSSTQTITPRFVDSIFFLFPLKASHHTVFKNPMFTNFQ